MFMQILTNITSHHKASMNENLKIFHSWINFKDALHMLEHDFQRKNFRPSTRYDA